MERIPDPGEVLIDKEGDGDNKVVVVKVADETAGEYDIPAIGNTVAGYNGTDPDEAVVEVRYQSGRGKVYAFPVSRLGEIHEGDNKYMSVNIEYNNGAYYRCPFCESRRCFAEGQTECTECGARFKPAIKILSGPTVAEPEHDDVNPFTGKPT